MLSNSPDPNKSAAQSTSQTGPGPLTLPERTEGLVRDLAKFTVEYTAAAAADLLGESKLVAIGEGTHRAKDMFDAQRDILKVRIEKYKCRKIFIEADQSDIASLNSAIQRGDEPAIARLVKGNMCTLSNAAMLDLCTFVSQRNNLYPDDRVTLVGIDYQTKKAAELLQEKINLYRGQTNPPTDVSMLSDLKNGWSQCEKELPGGVKASSLKSILTQVLDLESVTTDPELKRLLGSMKEFVLVDILAQNNGVAFELGGPMRDTLMAVKINNGVRSLAATENGAVVAHNGHVSFAPHSTFSDGMGGHLRYLLGQDTLNTTNQRYPYRFEGYKVLLQLAGGGNLAKMSGDNGGWVKSDCGNYNKYPQPKDGDLEYLLLALSKETGFKKLLVNIDEAKKDQVLGPLLQQYIFYVNSVGTKLNPSTFFPICVPEACNVILFHETVDAEDGV